MAWFLVAVSLMATADMKHSSMTIEAPAGYQTPAYFDSQQACEVAAKKVNEPVGRGILGCLELE